MSVDLTAVEQAQEDSAQRELSANIAEDFVEFSRGNVIANEECFLLTQFQYSTAWMYEKERYVNSVLIGPSAGGKTQVQKFAKRVLPSSDAYTATELTGSAAQDDQQAWNTSLLAPLDEIDKIGDNVREFLKSMAGEDEGYEKKRSVSDDSSETGRSTVTMKNHALPYQVLFAPEGDKESIPKELDNRMLKLYVEDNKHIREAIGRKEAGHTDITVTGLEHTYIYETTELEGALRRRYRSLPTTMETKDDKDVRFGGCYTLMPEWVWYAVRPIFDFSTTSTNRFFGMVFNLIRASAVLNEPHRRTVEKEVGNETVDAILVDPQDVANVLSCQRTLLGTTHSLDPRKRAILDAVRQLTDAGGEGATLNQLKDWLNSSDLAVPNKSTLRRILKEDLAEGFYIKVREGDGPNGADLYVYRSRGQINPPRVTNLTEVADRDGMSLDGYGVDVDDPFDGCNDPIRGQSFKAFVEDFEDEITRSTVDDATMDVTSDTSMSASEAMGGGDDSGETQSTIAEAANDDEETTIDGPIEQFVYERVRENVGDEQPFSQTDPQLEDYHIAGFVDEDTPVSEAATSDTPLDPRHSVWDQASKDDDWVTTEAAAKRELSNAFQTLREKDVFQLEQHSENIVLVRVNEVT
jgi:hypothetical protein